MNKRLFSVLAAVLLALVISLAGPAAAMAQPPDMVKVLIGFANQPGPAAEALVRGAGGSIKYTYNLVPSIAATIPQAAVNGLLRNPLVTVIEPDITVYAVDAYDTELNNTWGVKRIGAGTVHSGGNLGAAVKVAVIDSGVYYTHSDLAANYAGGYDFVNGDSDPMDDNGHGTHVAGTIAAVRNGVGVVGVAPAVKIYALKVLGAGGGGSYSDVIAALQWAVGNGIQVTNNSYGSSGDPGTQVKAAFDKAYYTYGVLHVAAAGNSGKENVNFNNVIYPARWDSVIAVAATDSSDQRASFSSTGPAVELAAPGVSINSTRVGGGYVAYSGTSMASPHVAGTAALVIASGPTTNTAVRQKLADTATDLGSKGRDNIYGYGLVNAALAAPAPVSYGTISGQVTDSSNSSAISGATVSDGTRTAITNEFGNYTIPNVPPATYTVTASADGYYSEVKSTTVTGGATSTVNFALTKIPVVQNGAISGVVKDTNNTPISGATVSDGTRTATTDSGGNYTISDVPPATYTVTASATGFLTSSKSVTVGDAQAVTADFTLEAVSQTDNVSINNIVYLPEGGRDGKAHLRITVGPVVYQGNPVGGASVSITVSRNGSPYASATGTTGTNGEVAFKFNNIPAGTYTTTVNGVNAGGLTWDGITPGNSFTR